MKNHNLVCGREKKNLFKYRINHLKILNCNSETQLGKDFLTVKKDLNVNQNFVNSKKKFFTKKLYSNL